MLTTYARVLEQGKVTRRGGSLTMDNRSSDDLVAQLQAEVEALRRETQRLRQVVKDSCRGLSA